MDKVLRDEDSERLRRVADEAYAAAALNHPVEGLR